MPSNHHKTLKSKSNSKRSFVIGDIHGAFLALKQLINCLELDKDDVLIFLGDYVDGWPESLEVIDFLMDLSKTYKTVFIRGNHDDLFYDWLSHGKKNTLWEQHGGKATLYSYDKAPKKKIEQHIRFLESLKDYFIDSNNRLFVHAGFTHLKGVKHEHFQKMLYWDRTLWETALSVDPLLKKEDEKYPKRLKIYTETFIGHTPTLRIGMDTPFSSHNVYNVDTGAGFNGKLSALDIESKEVYQSNVVTSFYPDAKPRVL